MADEGAEQSDTPVVEVSVLLVELEEALRSGGSESVESILADVESAVSERGLTAACEFVAAGVPITMRILQALGAQPLILKRCCHILFMLSRSPTLSELPVLSAASVAALRVAMKVTPVHDVERQVDQAGGKALALLAVQSCAPGLCAELREEALAAHVVECLLIGCRNPVESHGCVEALLTLCGDSCEARDACLSRVVACDGLNVVLTVFKHFIDFEGGWDKYCYLEVTVAGWLLSAMRLLVARTPDEALISKFESSEPRVLDVLLDLADAGLEADHVDVRWIEMMASNLAGFSRSARKNKRCSQEHAKYATETIGNLLRALLVELEKPPRIACACAAALKAFAGGCGGGDATSPGAYALHAGALEPLETALEKAKTKAEKDRVDSQLERLSRKFLWCFGSASDSELMDSIAHASAFVDKLRQLDAHKKKLMAEAADTYAKAAESHERFVKEDQEEEVDSHVAELVAIANSFTELYDYEQVGKALSVLSAILGARALRLSDLMMSESLQKYTMSQSLQKCMLEALGAGAVAITLKAVRDLGMQSSVVLEQGCTLLHYFSFLRPPPPRIVAASIAALHVVLDLLTTDHNLEAAPLRIGLGHALLGACVVHDAALRARALEAGAVELLIGDADEQSKVNGIRLTALAELCGPPHAVPDACAIRVLTAGGMRLAIGATRQWNETQTRLEAQLATAAVTLFARLHAIRLTGTAGALDPGSVGREENEMVDALFQGLDGMIIQSHSHGQLAFAPAAAFINTLGILAESAVGGRCAPFRAASATESIVRALNCFWKLQCVEVACASANALKAFARSCGDDDTFAPGSRALHAGALPLLESMLPAVEAELAAGGVDKATRKLLGTVLDFVRTLRDLKARREAALAELLADDKPEPAQRAKSGKPVAAKAKRGPQGKGSAAAAAVAEAEVQPPAGEVDEAAAALDAVSIADAAPAAAPAAEPERVVEPTPPPAPPAEPEPAAVTPPPLPQWLLQAVQRPLAPPPPPQAAPPQPPPAVPPPIAPAAPRGAWAQRPPAIAVAQQPPMHAAAPPQRPQPVELPRWNVPPPSPSSKPPAGAWGRGRPAISGLSAGEVPRDQECAICLDAVAEGCTPCCGQTAFCAPCAATLSGGCPLCRAVPGSASS